MSHALHYDFIDFDEYLIGLEIQIKPIYRRVRRELGLDTHSSGFLPKDAARLMEEKFRAI
ncbi:MAG: hypothetical protein EPN21_15895 [Methylococcaceae bacterium]|nr:MAG: hypothetical protein EPN21_15895 [Methylococcaceae bacterium]